MSRRRAVRRFVFDLARRLHVHGPTAQHFRQLVKLTTAFGEPWMLAREREAREAFEQRKLLAQKKNGARRSLAGTFYAAAVRASSGAVVRGGTPLPPGTHPDMLVFDTPPEVHEALGRSFFELLLMPSATERAIDAGVFRITPVDEDFGALTRAAIVELGGDPDRPPPGVLVVSGAPPRPELTRLIAERFVTGPFHPVIVTGADVDSDK